jgi:hypothetical protein
MTSLTNLKLALTLLGTRDPTVAPMLYLLTNSTGMQQWGVLLWDLHHLNYHHQQQQQQGAAEQQQQLQHHTLTTTAMSSCRPYRSSGMQDIINTGSHSRLRTHSNNSSSSNSSYYILRSSSNSSLHKALVTLINTPT